MANMTMDPAECALHSSDQHLVLSNVIRDGVDSIMNQNSTDTAQLIANAASNTNHLLNQATTNATNLSNQANSNVNTLGQQTQTAVNRLSDLGEKNMQATSNSAACLQKDIGDLQWRLMEHHDGRFDHLRSYHERYEHERRRDHSETLLGFRDVQTEVLRSRAEIEKEIANSKAAVELKVLKAQCELERQAADNRAFLEKDILVTKYELSKQASENHAKAELDCYKNKAELSKQMSDGFCEVKDKIESRYCNTVELIKTLDAQKYKDELAATREQLLLAKLRQDEPRGRRERDCGCPIVPITATVTPTPATVTLGAAPIGTR